MSDLAQRLNAGDALSDDDKSDLSRALEVFKATF